MSTATIAIIGAGNMGGSLLGGLIANHYPREKLWITDSDEQKLISFKKDWRIHATQDNVAAVQQADIVLLAVKPQILASVAEGISNIIQEKKPLVISIAAGVREANLQKWLGGQIPIVRAMPNTPALIRAGATALFANDFVTEYKKNLAESIMRSVGVTVWIQDEKWMDCITALSGSGPAYFFLIMEAMQNAAHELGLPKEMAKLLTLQTACGSAQMAMESDVDLIELRKRVTSPGGTTERALEIFEENHLREIFKKAINAAKIRSEELAGK